MKKIQNIAAFVFITVAAILTAISIMGVWKIFDDDVITKSFATFGLLGAVTVVVMIAGHYIEGRTTPDGQIIEIAPHPAFKDIRRATIFILVTVVSILALLGVMAIWDVVTDKDVLYKAIGSMAILAFSSLIVVGICLNREGSPMFSGKNKKISIGGIIILIILAYFLFNFLFFLRMFF